MDLSKLLGELYTAEHDDPVVEAEPARDPDPLDTSAQDLSGPDLSAPDWADESRLDEVFASWVPGPPPDAPSAEREMASWSHPDSSGEPDAELRPASQAVPDAAEDLGADRVRSWTRSDDDVLPYRRCRRRLSLLRR